MDWMGDPIKIMDKQVQKEAEPVIAALPRIQLHGPTQLTTPDVEESEEEVREEDQASGTDAEEEDQDDLWLLCAD